MTVAVGIETTGTGTVGAGLGSGARSTPGTALSAVRIGSAPASPSGPSFSGPEGFRSGWESLLASMGARMDGASKPETGAGTNSAGPAKVAAKNGEAGSDAAAHALFGSSGTRTAMGLRPGNVDEDGLASGAARVASSGAGLETPAYRAAGAVPGQAEAGRTRNDLAGNGLAAQDLAAKDRASAQPGGNADSAHRPSSRKDARHEAALAASAPALDWSAGSIALTIPAAGAAPVTTYAPEAQARISPAQLAAGSSHNFAQGFLGHPGMGQAEVDPERFQSVAGTAGNRAADKVGTAISAGKGAPASGQNGLAAGVSELEGEESGGVGGIHAHASGDAEQLSGGQSAPESGRMHAQAGAPQPAPVQSQNQVQAPVGGQAVADAAALAAGNSMGQEAEAGATVSSRAQTSPGSVARSSLDGDRRTLGPGAVKSAPGAGAAGTGQHGGQTVPAQVAGAAVNAPAWVRGPAEMHGPANATGGQNEASGAAAETGARATFAALDAGTGPGTPAWVHAGTQQAEAGFEDPALGWVGVRADLGAGGIHASLVPGSAEAAQALGGQMAGLHAFLAEQHTPVETLTMAAPTSGSTLLSADQGAMQQGSGQNAGQGSFAEPQSNAPPATEAISGAVPLGRLARSGGAEGIASFTGQGFARQGGVHISVMA
jgi:hypothetical protein